MRSVSQTVGIVLVLIGMPAAAQSPRALRFRADSPVQARAWQTSTRDKLFALMMGGKQPSPWRP